MKIVQNKKRAESETDDDDEDEDDEETPEETGTPIVYDTSKRDWRYVPIRTNPEEDTLQLHTDSEMPGENSELQKDALTEIVKNRIDTVAYPIRKTSGDEN